MRPDRYPIRQANPGDVERLIALMRSLAAFEGYLDRFRVTADDLRERAFGPQAQCAMLVAEGEGGEIAGYAVYLVQAFTFDLRPTVTLKELFVTIGYRRKGVAATLLHHLKHESIQLGAGRIGWLVLPSNDGAKALYRRFGGAPDRDWEHWQLELPPDSQR